MKAVSLLIRLSLIASASVALGLLTNRYELAAFSAATSTLLLLIAARDYAPRARRWTPRLAPVAPQTKQARPHQRLRLAA